MVLYHRFEWITGLILILKLMDISADDECHKELMKMTESLNPSRINSNGKEFLDRYDFDAKTLLGNGTSGHVYKVELKSKRGCFVAVKLMLSSPQAKREIKVMAKIDHPNFARLYEAYPMVAIGDEKFALLVQEYVEGLEMWHFHRCREDIINKKMVMGCLEDYKEKPNYKNDVYNDLTRSLSSIGNCANMSSYSVRRQLVRSFVSALVHLNQVGIMHLDIRPQNTLVTKEGNIKIMDFGAAREATELDVYPGGTPRYMAPEILDFKKWVLENRERSILGMGTTETGKPASFGFTVDWHSAALTIASTLSGRRARLIAPWFNNRNKISKIEKSQAIMVNKAFEDAPDDDVTKFLKSMLPMDGYSFSVEARREYVAGLIRKLAAETDKPDKMTSISSGAGDVELTEAKGWGTLNGFDRWNRRMDGCKELADMMQGAEFARKYHKHVDKSLDGSCKQ